MKAAASKPIRVQQTLLAFHPHAQRSGDRRDEHQQSRLFARAKIIAASI
jgi:hypothetical protein